MAANVLPNAIELALLTDLASVVAFSGLPNGVWRQVNAALGGFPNLRLLSQAPDGIAEAIATMQVPRLDADGNALDPPETRDLSMVESVQVALIWRVARQSFGLEDIDILAPGAIGSLGMSAGLPATGPNTIPVPAALGGSSKALGIQKVKVSQIADQLEHEVTSR